jgi:hypothetical protein
VRDFLTFKLVQPSPYNQCGTIPIISPITLVSPWLCLTGLTNRFTGAPEFMSHGAHTIPDWLAAQAHRCTQVPLCARAEIIDLALISIVRISSERQLASYRWDHSPYQELLAQLRVILTTPQKLAWEVRDSLTFKLVQPSTWEVRDSLIFKLVQLSSTTNVRLFQHAWLSVDGHILISKWTPDNLQQIEHE